MKILIGVHGLPPFSIGGAELVAQNVARHLSQRHQVTLFHPLPASRGPHGTEYRSTRAGVHIVARVLPPPVRFEDTYHLPAAEFWFASLLEELSPDVVIFHHLTGLSFRLPAMAQARGVPVVMTLHDYWPLCARGQLVDIDMRVCAGPSASQCARCLSDQLLMLHRWGRMGRTAMALLPASHILRRVQQAIISREAQKPPHPRIPVISSSGESEIRATAARIAAGRDALASCDLLTGPSQHILNSYQPWLASSHRTRLVRNSVPPRPRVRPERPAAPPIRIGFLGAVIPTKGVHVLLDAYRHMSHNEIQLKIAGPAPKFHRQPDYGQRMARIAGDLGVPFLGPLAPRTVPQFLAGLHALVVPSVWPENAPLVIGEAFRLGVPVIASDVGGTSEWVDDGKNGALLPPGDVERLHRLLETLIRDPAVLARWADGAWNTQIPSPKEERIAWEALVEDAMEVGGRRI